MIRRGQSFSGRERNCVFLNTESGRWADISGITGLDLADDGRAMALTDWDEDGDLDIWVANRTGPRIRFMKNNVQTNNHFLQLRLIGSERNRDAIGARLEVQLADGKPPLVRSLNAGGGFVSQSSKWLHFGVGQVNDVQHVAVRWPDGDREVLTGFKVDRRYAIIRTPDGSRVEDRTRTRAVHLVSTPISPKQAGTARVVLTRRLPLPPLEYETQHGLRLALEAPSGKPWLINVWASWCASCVAELAELSAHEQDLRKRGLSIVALRADMLATQPPKHATSTERGRPVIDDLSFPFELGVALPDTLKELTLLLGSAIFREQLPLPASFLVDERGHVAVIYKGRLTIEQLVSDLELVKQSSTALADAFPFAGRSAIDLFPMTAVDVARAYEEGGYFDDAEQEMVRYLVKTRRAVSAKTLSPTKEVKAELERTYLNLALMLRRQGRHDESTAVLQQAIKSFPENQRFRSESRKPIGF